MNKYKLVGCDLDGSLLNDALVVSDENRQAIELLTDKGVYFVPVTGRALSEMPDVAKIPQIRYIILSNGAVILDKKTQERIFMCISRAVSNFVLDTLKECDTYIIMHHDGETYAKNLSDDEIKSRNVCAAVHKLVNMYANKEDDFEDKAYLMDNVESFSVFFKDDSELEKCKSILSSDDRLYVVDGWEHNIEIFNVDAGKDKALKKLLQKLDIEQEEIITIGDSGNDIAMTKFAGLGLSVSNGCENLKNVADSVICSNNEHAVKYVLNEYF